MPPACGCLSKFSGTLMQQVLWIPSIPFVLTLNALHISKETRKHLLCCCQWQFCWLFTEHPVMFPILCSLIFIYCLNHEYRRNCYYSSWRDKLMDTEMRSDLPKVKETSNWQSRNTDAVLPTPSSLSPQSCSSHFTSWQHKQDEGHTVLRLCDAH